MLAHVKEMLSGGGLLVLLLGLVAILTGIGAAGVGGFGARRLSPRARVGVSLLGALPFLLLVAVAISLIGEAREAFFEAQVSPELVDPAERAMVLARAIGDQLNVIAILSMLLYVAAPASALGALLPLAFGPEGPPGRGALVTLGLGIATLGVIVAQALSGYAMDFITAFGAVAAADTASRGALLVTAGEEALEPVRTTRMVLVVLGVLVGLVAAALAARAARRGETVRPVGLGLSAVVLLCGATLFVMTRPLHADATHLSMPAEHPVEYAGSVLFPPDVPCRPPLMGPVFDFTGDADQVTLDGRPVVIGDVPSILSILEKNWPILHPREPFSPIVVFVAPGEMRLSRIAPFIAQSTVGTGYDHVQILGQRARMLESATREPMPRFEACGASVIIDVNAEERVSGFTTWTDLMRAAALAEELTLRP